MSKVKIILDSGAYTAFTKGMKLDIDQYAEFIKTHSDIFDYAINMDAIGDAKKSYQNWLYLRRKGVNVLPVYHIGSDIKYLLRYMQQTDYVLLGAVADMSTVKRVISFDNLFKKYLLDDTGYPKVKMHALGVTQTDLILRYPWYSVDSSRAAMAAANGKIFLPRIKFLSKGKYLFDYNDSVIVQVSNQGKMLAGSLTNFGAMPLTLKEIYVGLIEEAGFAVGNIYYVKQQEKAKKHLRYEKKVKQIFDIEEVESEKNTVTGDYQQRFLWNLYFLHEMQRRMPSYMRKLSKENRLSLEPKDIPDATTIYNVVASPSFIDMARGHNILISYAYTSKGNMERIKEFKNY